MLVALPYFASAQTIMTIGPASNFYVSPGQLVSFDGLVLTPSSAYNFSGANSITHNTDIEDDQSQLPLHILRSYDFSNGLNNYNGDMSIYYQASELNTLASSALQLDGWSSNWNPYTSTTGTNFTTASGLSNFSANEVTLGSYQVLPVTWLSANAERRQGGIRIAWATADETNCLNYRVQRSRNGSDWTIASPPINAVNQAGPNAYSWTDGSNLKGTVYYRIEQTALDGETRYSITMVIDDGAAIAWTTYPNPVESTLYIAIGRPGANVSQLVTSISVFDITGRQILSLSPSGVNPYPMNVSGLPAGYYTLSVNLADGDKLSTGFIKRSP